MATFGELIRSYRLRAGLGLRTFAELIDQRASIVSAVESGRRAPWRTEATLGRVAEVLGLVESSNLWQKILKLAHSPDTPQVNSTNHEGLIAWWWQAEDVPALDETSLAEMAEFLGESASIDADRASEQKAVPLTELAIEWRVRKLLGRRETHQTAAPIDVEAALENEAGVRIEIVPGLIPRFSVQACVVTAPTGITFYLDRIIADSRPMAAYRQLLALCYAPAALWQADMQSSAGQFMQMRSNGVWAGRLRDCERFALAMLLPANPVLLGAESAYSELIQQQGWIDVDDAARTLRNRLAEQFAVPTSLVHRRLVGWPCHLYGRVAQALAAQEPTLPPVDWIVEDTTTRQRTLFDLQEFDLQEGETRSKEATKASS